MALILIGTGIAFDLTVSGLEAVKSCDEVYLETYTNPVNEETLISLEKLTGRKIERLNRDKVESSYLIEKARTGDICILASGDPLTATTHITLVLEAREKKVSVKVIHNSSIHSVAPARAGLQMYRFGKTATLVNPRENYKPTSSLDIIRENLKRDLHTLVLLDTEPEPMEASTALSMLSEFDSAIVLSNLGFPDERITYGKISELKNKELGKAPFTVIVPAKLHAVEEEYLATL